MTSLNFFDTFFSVLVCLSGCSARRLPLQPRSFGAVCTFCATSLHLLVCVCSCTCVSVFEIMLRLIVWWPQPLKLHSSPGTCLTSMCLCLCVCLFSYLLLAVDAVISDVPSSFYSSHITHLTSFFPSRHCLSNLIAIFLHPFMHVCVYMRAFSSLPPAIDICVWMPARWPTVPVCIVWKR